MNDSYVPLDRPRAFTDVLSAVVDILRLTWKRLLSDVVVIAGIWMLVGGVLIGIVARTFFGAIGTPLDPFGSFDAADLITTLGIGGAGVLLMIIGSVMEVIVVMAFFREYHALKRVPDRSEVRAAMRELWPRIVTALILMTMILVLGYLMLFIPGIYVSVPLLMMLPIRAFEGGTFGTAFSRCMQLVRDRWWWTLGIYICLSIAVSVINGITQIPYLAVSMASAIASAASESTEWLLVIQAMMLVLQYIGAFILQIITFTGLVVLYFAHVERVDGTGLLRRIEDIGTADAA